MARDKKIVVTGGAGFIGSHLVERLLDDGGEVMVIDNLSTGRMENLERVKVHPRFTFQEADVSKYDEIEPLFKDVAWVFHLAGLADIVPSIQKPLEYFSSNVEGTLSVLEAARHAGVKRFVYAASSSCYGISDVYPTPETASIRPQYPYALTKYLGEECVLHWGQIYKLPVVSLRLFNVFGPRSRTSGVYGAVFGVFMAQKLGGQPFTVVGDGTQTRDFTFVSDVAEAFIMAARSNLTGEVMNVGSGSTYSINLLVELLGGDVIHLPKRPGEPDCTFADITKIQRLLGWKSRVSFQEGVQVMLENINRWREAPVWTPETIAVATREWFECLR